MAWSAGGRLASGAEDGSIIVWDLDTGQPDQTLEGHAGWVSSVAWSADGRPVSGTRDRTVQVWPTDPKEWIRGACDRAGRNLAQAEWQLYFPGEAYRKTCEQWPEGQ